MDKLDIVRAILSKDAGRIAEAKGAIKSLLDARATQFRTDSSKFVAKSLFESEVLDEANNLDNDRFFKLSQKLKSQGRHLKTANYNRKDDTVTFSHSDLGNSSGRGKKHTIPAAHIHSDDKIKLD